MVGENLVRGTRGALREDVGGLLGERECGEGKVALHVLTPSPSFGSPGPSIPSTSLLSVRYDRRQEPANSPWYKNLTLGCPAKGEGLTQSGARLIPLLLGLLLPTPAKLN